MEFVLHISEENQITNSKVIWENFRKLSPGKYLVQAKSIKKRSLSQNQYWWGCLVPMFKDGLVAAGWDEIKTNEQAHEWLKDELLKVPYVNKNTGEVKYKTGSTKELTTSDFSLLIDAAIKLAAEYLNVQIPYPNEPLMMFNEPSKIYQ